MPVIQIDASQDTDMDSGNPQSNYGSYSSLLYASSGRSLIKFDCSAIPAEAICNSVQLRLFQNSTWSPSPFTITVYSISAGNADWIEGTGYGLQAASGEPCWNARKANGSGGVLAPWAGSAGLTTSGVDYETPALGSTTGNQSDPNGTQYTITLTPARVESWFGPSVTNYGLLLVATADVGGIGERGEYTAAWRPKLVVTYTHHIDAAQGSYAISGKAAGLRQTSLMPAAVGGYAATGIAAAKIHHHRLVATRGEYVAGVRFVISPQTPPERVFRVARENRIYTAD